MNKVYIRGVMGKNNAVIKKLEQLGGTNNHCMYGDDSNYLFYINPSTGIIERTKDTTDLGIALMMFADEVEIDKQIAKVKPFDVGDPVNLYGVRYYIDKITNVGDEVIYVLNNGTIVSHATLEMNHNRK